MKMRMIAVTAVVAAAISISYCKKADEHQGHMMDTDTTKSVMIGNVQAVFDLMDREHHDGMMKQMGGGHGGEGTFSHYILLTMMKKAERKLIMDAEVTLALTGPDGKTVEKKAHVMSGMGMHHYAAGFDMGAKGDYKVKAAIKQAGGDMSAEARFTVK
ncbi:MAG: hypothetical protein KBA61_19305 [Spirochaetes bacterium]|nr:hypothetical protein [Spirochaetota bacterium]